MARQTEWQSLIADCVEETIRLVDQAEDFVYDYMTPQLLETGPPQEREAFLQGVDMTQLKAVSPKLWARYSGEALGMVAKQQQDAAKALQDLEYANYKADRAFRPQVNPPRIFGLRSGNEATTTVAQGLDNPLPMGVFR